MPEVIIPTVTVPELQQYRGFWAAFWALEFLGLRKSDPALKAVLHEAITAARADGPIPRPVPGWDTGPSNSTWQSLSRQTGNVETDFFNGEIVRLAHRHGITAPLNAALARAARAAVRNGLGPGAYSAAQLAELLGMNALTTTRRQGDQRRR